MAEDRKGDIESVSREVSYAEYMNALSEKILDNSKQLKRSVHQRRNGMEDLYGVCFSSHATETNKDSGRYEATFYVSLSPDYIYLHRFAFKFVIMPSIVDGEDPSEGRDWKITIGGVDITEYLEEQQESSPLFNGEGVYPTNKGLDQEDFYDILDVVSVMIAEGNDDDANKIISPAFKKVTISSVKPFSADSYLYMKFSTVSR